MVKSYAMEVFEVYAVVLNASLCSVVPQLLGHTHYRGGGQERVQEVFGDRSLGASRAWNGSRSERPRGVCSSVRRH